MKPERNGVLYCSLFILLLSTLHFLYRAVSGFVLLCTATAFGQGVYFAVDFSYSAQRAYSPPDPNGVKYVFQCRVLTGQFVVGRPDMKEPPQRGSTKFRYDSVTNSASDPRIFVIFKDTQAYPEYLVSFNG